MIRRSLLALSAITLTLLAVSEANAQNKQNFTVRVPEILSITAPGPLSITIDEATDSPELNPTDPWLVFCNARAGGSFTLTAGPFVNQSDASLIRNAQLDLTRVGGGSPFWKVTPGSTTSTTSGAGTTAVVRGASTKPGRGEFSLKVTMLDVDFDNLAAGDYLLTVEGLISAN